MKKIFLLVTVIFLSHTVKSQVVKDTSLMGVDSVASFKGGLTEWRNFLMKNLNPSVPTDHGAPVGNYTAIIKFIVYRNGTIGDITAQTHNGYGIEEECIRVMKISSGKWIPAKVDGRDVNSYEEQPFRFVVEIDDDKKKNDN